MEDKPEEFVDEQFETDLSLAEQYKILKDDNEQEAEKWFEENRHQFEEEDLIEKDLDDDFSKDIKELEIKSQTKLINEKVSNHSRLFHLYNLWKNYVDTRCVGNEWAKLPMFHIILGQLMNGMYLDSGKKKSWRLHLFLIQTSRSGKGELMKAAKYLFVYFNKMMKSEIFKSVYLSRDVTPQMLIGGNEQRIINLSKDENKTKKGKADVFIPGILENYCYISWGEGCDLINPGGKDYGNLKSVILNATDEPGFITTSARKDLSISGEISERITNSSLVTGTVPLKEINDDLLQSGLLQRFLVSFKILSEKELDKLQEDVIMMGTNIADENEKTKEEFYNYFYLKPYTNLVKFKEEDLIKYIKLKKEITQKYISNFIGTKKEIMRSFIMSSVLFDKKIASQVAALEGREFVTFADLEYATTVTNITLDSITGIIHREYFYTKEKGQMTRQEIIINVIKDLEKDKEITNQKNIMKRLSKLKNMGKWDFGQNKTLEFIKDLVNDKIINCCEKSIEGKQYLVYKSS